MGIGDWSGDWGREHGPHCREEIAQAVAILKEKRIDAWLMFVRERNDAQSGHRDGRRPALHMADGRLMSQPSRLPATWMSPPSKPPGATARSCTYFQGIGPDLRRVLDRHAPKSIAVNYSVDSVTADGLTHGMYLQLLQHLEGTPHAGRLVSAEGVISALRGRKTPAENRPHQESHQAHARHLR